MLSIFLYISDSRLCAGTQHREALRSCLVPHVIHVFSTFATLSRYMLSSWQALGFLNLLMPTHAIAARQGEWSRWVPMWLDLQDGVAHCRWWDATWMDLISRVAKHDKHGAKACESGGYGVPP